MAARRTEADRTEAPEPEWIDVDACTRFTKPRLARSTVLFWIKVGKLKATKPGKRLYVRRADFLALMEKGR